MMSLWIFMTGMSIAAYVIGFILGYWARVKDERGMLSENTKADTRMVSEKSDEGYSPTGHGPA